MLSTDSFQAYGGMPVAPPHLFRSPSSCAADLALTVKPGSSRRGGTDSKLRIGNFITFSGAPGSGADLRQQRHARGRRDQQARRHPRPRGRTVDVRCRRADRRRSCAAPSGRSRFDEIDIIMGSHISAVRLALRKVTSGRIPYVYTPVYEGGERTPGVMAIGETPRAESRPAIHWLTEVKKATALVPDRQRLCLALAIAPRGEALHHGGRRTGGRRGVRPARRGRSRTASGADPRRQARRRADHPDRHRQHHLQPRLRRGAGSPATTLRYAGAMDETVLLGIGPDATEILFCASGYFGCVDSRANDDFRISYRAMFGAHAPPIGSVGQSNYEGMRFVEAAANRAGSLSVGPLFVAATQRHLQRRARRRHHS